jgi:transcriptional regulator with GAF, ATPase, and Fis domain
MVFSVYAIVDDGVVIKMLTSKTEANYFLKLNKGTTLQVASLKLDEMTLKTLMRDLKIKKNKEQASKQKQDCVEVYNQSNQNIGVAARKLGITYENLYNNLRRQGIIGKINKKSKKTIEAEENNSSC